MPVDKEFNKLLEELEFQDLLGKVGQAPAAPRYSPSTGMEVASSEEVPELQRVGTELRVNAPGLETPFLDPTDLIPTAPIAKAIGGVGKMGVRAVKDVFKARATQKALQNPGKTVGRTVSPETAKMMAEEDAHMLTPETLQLDMANKAELPKYAGKSAINLDRIEGPQDLKSLQNALSGGIKKNKVTWEETRQAAKDLAWSEEDFLKKAKKKGGFSAEEIYAARQISRNSLDDLYSKLSKPASQISDAERADILDAAFNHMEISKQLSGKSSEAGRALNIHRKMMSEDPEFLTSSYRQEAFQKMMDKTGGKKLTDDMIDDLRKVGSKDPEGTLAVLQKYHKANTWDKLHEAWINGRLSNPATHTANALGNTLSIISKIPEDTLGSLLAGGGKQAIGTLRSELTGLFQGLPEGVSAGLKALKAGVPEDILARSGKVDTKYLNAIPGKTGEVIRLPSRFLTAGDEFFKPITYRMELNKQAHQLASATESTTKGIQAKMQEILNGDSPLFNLAHESAHKEAMYRTFNNPLGDIGRKVMGLRNEIPGARYIAPFVRTPTNIMKYMAERTPLNVPRLALMLKRGQITPEEFKRELAKPIIGSMIGAATTAEALKGNITGGAPSSARERELLFATGWQPYSVKLGDTYYGYNRLDPIGGLMGLSADFGTASQSAENINGWIGKMAGSVGKNITSKTYLEGVSNLLDAITDPEQHGEKFLSRFAGSLIPFGALSSSISASVDPYARETNNPLDAIKSQIPLLSETLPYKGVKMGGADWAVKRNKMTALERVFSPIPRSQGEDLSLKLGPRSITEPIGGSKDVADVALEVFRTKKDLRLLMEDILSSSREEDEDILSQ